MNKNDGNQPAFTGFGNEWRPSNLTPGEARAATAWVETKIDRRSMLTNKERVEDIRDAMWQLEKEGEIVVHRIDDRHAPVTARTLYGWEKRIPTNNLWHHKSCGQCGNIPGYPSSVIRFVALPVYLDPAVAGQDSWSRPGLSWRLHIRGRYC